MGLQKTKKLLFVIFFFIFSNSSPYFGLETLWKLIELFRNKKSPKIPQIPPSHLMGLGQFEPVKEDP